MGINANARLSTLDMSTRDLRTTSDQQLPEYVSKHGPKRKKKRDRFVDPSETLGDQASTTCQGEDHQSVVASASPGETGHPANLSQRVSREVAPRRTYASVAAEARRHDAVLPVAGAGQIPVLSEPSEEPAVAGFGQNLADIDFTSRPVTFIQSGDGAGYYSEPEYSATYEQGGSDGIVEGILPPRGNHKRSWTIPWSLQSQRWDNEAEDFDLFD